MSTPRIQYTTTTDGVRIACWTRGDRHDSLPLVYLAGGPWSHIELRGLPTCSRWDDHLARTRLLVRYDIRGTGRSQREISDYRLDALVLEVEAVVRRLGLERFALLRAADAGPVALTFAVRYPAQVSRLVLWCAWARSTDIAVPRIVAWLRSLVDDWEFMTETCAHLALGWSAGEAGRQAARCLRESVTPETARVALAALREADVTPLLPQVTTPTLVVHRRDIARGLASQFPDARLLLLDGEATAPALGDASAALDAIETFLGEADEAWATGQAAGQPTTDQPVPSSGRIQMAPDGLTAREIEVLRRLASGATNAAIPAELSLSVRTVERHVANIYGKIAARGRANATAYALTHGLV